MYDVFVQLKEEGIGWFFFFLAYNPKSHSNISAKSKREGGLAYFYFFSF